MEARRLEEFPHWPIERWPAVVPPGEIRQIYLHWSGFDYAHVFTSYHYCVALAEGAANVVETHDLRNNMRDVYVADDRPYAAHTFRRNAFAAGVSIMGMEGATPADFGRYPLAQAAIDALARITTVLAQAYAIPIVRDRVLTHAEAAVADGYFGAGEDERWDIARLGPSPLPLVPLDAARTGDELRRLIAEAQNALTRRD